MDIAYFAKLFATEKHEGQMRKCGKPYITHPEAVAELIGKYKKSVNIKRLQAAAWLHDVLEDTDTTYYDLVESFGYDIASLVMEVTNNDDMKEELGKQSYLAYKIKHLTSYGLLIKLCDRLHNCTELEYGDDDFKKRYIEETHFVLDYIENNRELTPAHEEIIIDIKKILESL